MTGAEEIKIFDTLKTARGTIDAHRAECYKFTFPIHGAGFLSSETVSADQALAISKTQQSEMFDSTAAEACNILAAAIVSGMTPANSQWGSMEAEGVSEATNKWLDEASKTVHKNIHASNFDGPAFERARDMAVAGMSALYVDESESMPYNFELWALSDCYFAASKRNGLIDIVYHPFSLEARQAVNEYGEDVPKKISDAAELEPSKSFRFLHVIKPRPAVPKGKRETLKDKLQPFISLHICIDSKQIVRTSGYAEFPLIVPRWVKIPGSVYATGPMTNALPDVKTVNAVEKLTLAAADMAIAGMWGAKDDGVLNPKTVRVGARKVIMMESKDSMWPLTPGGSLNLSAITTAEKRAAIKRCMMADMLETQTGGPARTAEEIRYRAALVRQLLGPTYGRLQSEDLQPLFFRCFGISLRKGDLGAPPEELRNKRIKLKFISPLARGQQIEDVAAIVQHETELLAIAAQGKPELLDTFDFDQSANIKANLRGVPAALLIDMKLVEKNRKDRQAAMMQAQQAQQNQAMTEKMNQQQPEAI